MSNSSGLGPRYAQHQLPTYIAEARTYLWPGPLKYHVVRCPRSCRVCCLPSPCQVGVGGSVTLDPADSGIFGDQSTPLPRLRIVKSSDLIDHTRQEAIYNLRVERVSGAIGISGVFHSDNTIEVLLGVSSKFVRWVVAYIVVVCNLSHTTCYRNCWGEYSNAGLGKHSDYRLHSRYIDHGPRSRYIDVDPVTGTSPRTPAGTRIHGYTPEPWNAFSPSPPSPLWE